MAESNIPREPAPKGDKDIDWQKLALDLGHPAVFSLYGAPPADNNPPELSGPTLGTSVPIS